MKENKEKEKYAISEYIGAFVIILIFLSLIAGIIFCAVSFIEYARQHDEVTAVIIFVYGFCFFMYIMSGDWLDLFDK